VRVMEQKRGGGGGECEVHETMGRGRGEGVWVCEIGLVWREGVGVVGETGQGVNRVPHGPPELCPLGSTASAPCVCPRVNLE
jgi:hypothetical protein